MIEIIFRSFWTWVGTLILVVYGLGIICNCIVRVVEVIRHSEAPQDKEAATLLQDCGWTYLRDRWYPPMPKRPMAAPASEGRRAKHEV